MKCICHHNEGTPHAWFCPMNPAQQITPPRHVAPEPVIVPTTVVEVLAVHHFSWDKADEVWVCDTDGERYKRLVHIYFHQARALQAAGLIRERP